VNLFCACGEDFNSVGLFDRHRVGRHAYDFVEGLELGVEDGRRCLDTREMRNAGWRLNGRGRWIDPARAGRARHIGSAKRRGPV
jgi:hypothetical protein